MLSAIVRGNLDGFQGSDGYSPWCQAQTKRLAGDVEQMADFLASGRQQR
jgi:hypothetical protein